MKIAYLSLLLPEEKHLEERTKGKLPGVSLHKFTRALIEGLDENLDEPATIFNLINTVNFPSFPQMFFRTEKWHHHENSEDLHIGYINLFGIKYITQENNLYHRLSSWCKKNLDDQLVICVHHIYYPAMMAAYRIKKKYGSKVMLCLITGDMNGQYGLQSQNSVNIKQKLIDKMNTKIDYLATQFDTFVFATKYMASGFKVENKSWTVVECMYSESNQNVDLNYEDDKLKKIFYAGSVRKEYGIPHLLRAFSMIKDPDFRLEIAGDGNCLRLVKEYAEKDRRITYHGFIPPKKVDELQNEASILVNPRITKNNNFVKYSFPSKTMECLASGRPYVAHELPCNPPEYSSYIQYCKNESDEALADKLIEVGNLSLERRKEIGLRGREFVLKQKNPVVMTKSIVDMWSKYWDAKNKRP